MVLFELFMRVPFTIVKSKSSENVWLVISKYLVLSTSPVGVLVVLEVSDVDNIDMLLELNTTPRGEISIEQSKKTAEPKMIATVVIT